jgi:hypothetical protein
MEEWGSNEDWGIEWNDVGKSYRSDHEITESVLKQRAIKKKLKNEQMHYIRAKALSDICGEPAEGEQWRIITEKQFNAFALILHLLQTRVIEEMYLAVYRINEPTVTSIIEFIESGKIKKSVFVISSFFNQTKKPEQWAIMLKQFADKKANCYHVYTHNHAKVLAVRTSKNEFFVFEGSGNMSDNARIEQYIYENSKQSFEFHKKWMTELCNKKSKSGESK